MYDVETSGTNLVEQSSTEFADSEATTLDQEVRLYIICSTKVLMKIKYMHVVYEQEHYFASIKISTCHFSLLCVRCRSLITGILLKGSSVKCWLAKMGT